MEQQGKPIYIFGHLNPDTDSTCAAIAYAYLKNQINPNQKYIPAILSDINPETEYVLDRFNVPVPKIVKHLRPVVSDIPFREVPKAYEMDSIRKVLEMIVGHIGRSIPVVDDSERLIGIVSISDLVPLLLASHDKSWLTQVKVPMNNLIENLDLNLVYGGNTPQLFEGNIHFYNDLGENQILGPNDLLICNISEFKAKDISFDKLGFIIITDYNPSTADVMFDGLSCTIFVTSKNTYEVLHGISHAFPIQSVIRKDDIEYFSTDETVDEVKKNMQTSKYRRFPVVDESGHIQGMISRGDLTLVEPKSAILVDHNEKNQSIEGISDVKILEVIDHHRVANIQTDGPLYFRVEPLGSTCTIIAKLFEENKVPIPMAIAGLLLSGILSDTLLFKSPTCTPEDEEMAKKLADIAEVPIKAYGMSMITKGARLQDATPESIISTDYKRFTFGRYKAAIAQVNIVDFEGFYEIYEDIKSEMRKKCDEEELDLFVLMATSILIGGSEIIALGKEKWLAEHAFNIGRNEESIFLDGVFSRKKQIVPKLMQIANQA